MRQIKLDTIASDLVESVEINKTLQANIDADGIGGSVNLRTKTAGELPTMDALRTGRLHANFDQWPWRDAGAAARWASASAPRRSSASCSAAPMTTTAAASTILSPRRPPSSLTPHYDSMDIRDYVYDRTRWGATTSLDYKLGEGSSVYLRGLFSTFRNWGHKWTLRGWKMPLRVRIRSTARIGAVRTWRSATW